MIFFGRYAIIHEQLNVCQKVKCALKPQSDERARDIFGHTAASGAVQKLRHRKRVYTWLVLLQKLSLSHNNDICNSENSYCKKEFCMRYL